MVDDKDDKQKQDEKKKALNGHAGQENPQPIPENLIIDLEQFKARREEGKKTAPKEAAREAALNKEQEQHKKLYNTHIRPKNPPIFNIPPMTNLLLIIIVSAFLLQYFGSSRLNDWIMEHLAFQPSQFSGLSATHFMTYATPITHMFLHGGWFHLGMNAAMLLAFGSGVERAIGGRFYLMIFVISGIIGAFSQYLLNPDSVAFMVGASGGISGLFGAVLIVLQRSGGLGTGTTILPFILLWVILSVVMGVLGTPDNLGGYQNIAWAAHLGGFLAGLGVMKLIVNKR